MRIIAWSIRSPPAEMPTDASTMTELANCVRAAREAKGWTQAELATRIDVSRKTVNTVENAVFVPSTVIALKLARALGEPVEALFSLVE